MKRFAMSGRVGRLRRRRTVLVEALALVALLVAVETRAAATPGARGQAELLAQAGEARYRLALLRSRKTDPGPDPDLESALHALKEACELDPANLRALAYLGLARLESAARGGKPLDRKAFDPVRGPLEDLFKLSRGWADPRTRALLGEVARSVDASLADMDDAPADVLGWWQSWRGRVTRTAKSAPPGAGVVTLVEDLRTSPLAWVRERAAEKLGRRKGKLQPGVAEALGKALREDKSPWVRAAAAKALSTLTPPGWDVRLAEALKNDESVWVRRTCAREFTTFVRGERLAAKWGRPTRYLDVQEHHIIRPPSKTAREALMHALASDTPRVACQAALALANASGAGEALLRALESPSTLVRHAASSALAWHASSGSVRERVGALLADKRAGIRAAAARAFAGVAEWGSAGLLEEERLLIKLFDDPSAEVRAAAAAAFARKVPGSARPLLDVLLKDDDPRVRLAAASVLGKTGDAARRVLESLVDSEVPLNAWSPVAGLRTVGTEAREILEILSVNESKEGPRP